MHYKIKPITTDNVKETILFAAEELKKYLCTVSENEILIIPSAQYDKNEENVIYVGINLSDMLPTVENSLLDDAIYINVEKNRGVITGNNPRSVLIAVYRYLREKGFCFIRPGKEGEIYPDVIDEKAVNVCEAASYRHRGVCIEGSVFQENLMDIIDWLPKVAMNGYFIQFQLPREFFDRWYKEETPYRGKLELTDDEIRSIVALAETEMEKRDLLYHGVGHGWTTQAFGIEGSSWSEHEEPEPEYRDVLALVNGERKLWKGIPLDTNLCYSKEKARNRVTDNIVDYCKTHKNVSYLHFWLADDNNNNCECEECRKLRTSDYYVMMLNELDEKLAKEGLDTKIVFLVYVDLLWKPISERLKNKDRFVLMFAPITRSYSVSFDPETIGEMQPYELNKLKFPENVEENLAYLYDWQKDFECDSFDFDYHFVWDQYIDFPQYTHAQILHDDIQRLGDMGLNGLVSCQVQRVFFPSSLGMNVMAQTLWDKKIDFDSIAEYVLEAEFGEKYSDVKKYLKTLSELGCAEALRKEKKIATSENQKNFAKSIQLIEEFERLVYEQIENAPNERLSKAWEKLKFFSELYNLMLKLYLEYAKGNAVEDCSHIRELVLKNEVRFKDELDAMFYIYIFEKRIVEFLKSNK